MKSNSSLKNQKFTMIKLIIALIAIYFIYIEGSKQLKKYDFIEVMNLLQGIKLSSIITLLIFAFITVSSMTIYDYFLLKHINYNVSLFRVWKISWIANSFNNFLNFAGLTGASLRTFLYKKQGISTKEAIYASAMMAPSTVIGICIASWLIILNVLKVRPVLIQYRFLWLGLIGFALYVIIYILLYEWKWLSKKIMSKVEKCENSPKELRWKLVGSSAIEWTLICLFFWFICSVFTGEIIFLEAAGIIVISAIAGIISFIPGGMGSFDLICLVGLEFMGASSERAMTILITYRVFYYIVPWFLGVILGMTELIDRKYYKTT